jgi:hypothetical protein
MRREDRRWGEGLSVFSLLIELLSEVSMPKIHISRKHLPKDPNSDEDLTEDQVIDGLMKLTAESLAEQYD